MILDLQKSKDLIDSLNSYRILVGVIQRDSMREGTYTDIITRVQVGVTNAELMFIHENGSPMRNLPKRPVLQYTVEWAQGQIEEVLNEAIEGIFEGWNRKEVENHFKRFCIRIQNYAQNMIYNRDPRLEANKPATIKYKKSDLPLFDTGQLARSITAELIRV